MSRPKVSAARLVLALYPPAVRDRYGPEIADLLAHSRRPVRDLADVARCALGERARTLTAARLRPHLHATAGLVAAPVAFTGAYLAIGTLFMVVVAVVTAGPSPAGVTAVRVLMAAAAAPVAAGAVWLAGHARPPAVAALVPVGLAAGMLPLASLLTGPGPVWPAAAAVGCWCVATAALSTTAAVALRRGHRLRAVLTMAVGGVLACELAFTVYGMAILGRASWAFGLYPVTALGLDPQLLGAGAGQVGDAARLLSVLLTTCTAYAFGLATRAGVALRPALPDTR